MYLYDLIGRFLFQPLLLLLYCTLYKQLHCTTVHYHVLAWHTFCQCAMQPLAKKKMEKFNRKRGKETVVNETCHQWDNIEGNFISKKMERNWHVFTITLEIPPNLVLVIWNLNKLIIRFSHSSSNFMDNFKCLKYWILLSFWDHLYSNEVFSF